MMFLRICLSVSMSVLQYLPKYIETWVGSSGAKIPSALVDVIAVP